MAEIFPGSGFQGKPPKPKSLSETFEEIKDIAKGVGIGESFDLAGAPADITDAFFSARKALFPYSDLGEQKAAEKLAQGIGAEALIKKAGILKNLPKTFEATRYHSLIIDKKTLSKDLEITAETKDGLIMGVQHKKYNVHGVQFHPESIKTKIGIKILKNFITV